MGERDAGGVSEQLHYLGAIRLRLERLYAISEDDSPLREKLSDEVDWIDAHTAAIRSTPVRYDGEAVAFVPCYEAGPDIAMARKKRHTIERYIKESAANAFVMPLYATPPARSGVREALEPFAKLNVGIEGADTDEWFRHDGEVLHVGDFRRARTALSQWEKSA